MSDHISVSFESKAKEIHAATDLSKYTYEELRATDAWIKHHAMYELKRKLKDQPKAIRDYLMLIARCHYGSVETDEFLKAMGCYPEWL